MPLIELNETQHFQRQAELQQFLQNNVTKSDKLTKRFEEFFLSEYNKTFYCGVSRNCTYLNKLYYFFLLFFAFQKGSKNRIIFFE